MRIAAAASLTLALAAGCSSNAPWDVPDGEELRFRRTAKECRLLTLDDDGYEGPISFDQCMRRRGWRRQGPLKRLLSS